MGAEVSRSLNSSASASRYDAQAGSEPAPAGLSVWEGVPPEICWLVQAQVRLLLSHDPEALLLRPKELAAEEEHGRQMSPHEARLASLTGQVEGSYIPASV